jgi:hypothetical protein
MTAIDINAQVSAWFHDQINSSTAADEDHWVSSFTSIIPIDGQSVAGFMLILWVKSPLLGQAPISTGNFMTGIPSEDQVREAARGMVAKLHDDRSKMLRAAPSNGNVVDMGDISRRFRKN